MTKEIFQVIKISKKVEEHFLSTIASLVAKGKIRSSGREITNMTIKTMVSFFINKVNFALFLNFIQLMYYLICLILIKVQGAINVQHELGKEESFHECTGKMFF